MDYQIVKREASTDRRPLAARCSVAPGDFTWATAVTAAPPPKAEVMRRVADLLAKHGVFVETRGS